MWHTGISQAAIEIRGGSSLCGTQTVHRMTNPVPSSSGNTSHVMAWYPYISRSTRVHVYTVYSSSQESGDYCNIAIARYCNTLDEDGKRLSICNIGAVSQSRSLACNIFNIDMDIAIAAIAIPQHRMETFSLTFSVPVAAIAIPVLQYWYCYRYSSTGTHRQGSTSGQFSNFWGDLRSDPPFLFHPCPLKLDERGKSPKNRSFDNT